MVSLKPLKPRDSFVSLSHYTTVQFQLPESLKLTLRQKLFHLLETKMVSMKLDATVYTEYLSGKM